MAAPRRWPCGSFGESCWTVRAPTLNLMRTPLGGRGFEFFAEDPVLTARMAVAYVRGLQRTGVAATLKHYVGNDSETGRWSYDARIDRDRATRAVPGAL